MTKDLNMHMLETMKNCLITGSSGLIGTGLCREFLENGYRVFGLDLRPGKELKHQHFSFIRCDLKDEEDVKKAYSQIEKLDVLINNAAIASPENKKLHLLELSQWNEMMATNLTSVFLMSKHAIPKLKKSRGSIINISSVRHLMSEPDTEIYSAAKGGIDALTRAMAISLGPKVRVNSISPGWIVDPKKKLSRKDHEQHPAGRVGYPADIAKFAIYLASPDAGFVTGSDFIVDGGMMAKLVYDD